MGTKVRRQGMKSMVGRQKDVACESPAGMCLNIIIAKVLEVLQRL